MLLSFVEQKDKKYFMYEQIIILLQALQAEIYFICIIYSQSFRKIAMVRNFLSKNILLILYRNQFNLNLYNKRTFFYSIVVVHEKLIAGLLVQIEK